MKARLPTDPSQPLRNQKRTAAAGRQPQPAANSRHALLSVLDDKLQTEQRLLRSEALLNETQALAKVGGWEYDVAAGRMQWTNEVFRIYGVPGDYDAGDVWRDIALFPERERVRLSAAFQRALEHGEPYDLELQFVTPNGRRLWVRTVARAESRDGKVIRIFGNVIDITERKREEETQARLAAIVANSNDIIFGRALDGTIISWNAAAERILGYTAAEVIGQKPEFHPPELNPVVAARRRRLLAGQPGEHFEEPRIAKDGRRIDAAISVSVIKDAGGDIIGFAAIMRDITERKRIERELQHKTELAQLLEQLARAANEAVSPEAAMQFCLERICKHGKWALGRVATFVTAESRSRAEYSQWYCPEPARLDAFMRYSDSHAVHVDAGKFVGTVLRERHPVWLADLSTVDKPESGRLRVAVEAGLKSAFAFPVIVGGKVAAILEFFATETRAPDALLVAGTGGLASQFARMIERSAADEARARLAAIVESSSDAIIGRTLDGTITSWNAAAERILGYTAAEAIGRELIEVQPPELRAEHGQRRRRILAGGPGESWETVRVAKDGRRVDVATSVSAVKDHRGRIIGTAVILRDISERKRAERELQHKTELALLLEQLARAANEAVSPEAAMETCLARICKHGRWALGRVATFQPSRSRTRSQHSQWYCTEPARFGAFMRHSESFVHNSRTGQFIPLVLRERIPVWLPELAVLDNPPSGRFVRAAEAGLKAAFAFPVIVGSEVVAVLEFFATETRPPDVLLIEGVGGLASQFARMLERSAANETRARLAAIVENSTDAVISRNVDGLVTSWNAAAERIFGYTAAEAIGRDMVEIQPPELRQETAALRQRLLAGEPAMSGETVRVAKDGRRIDVAISMSAIKDPGGRITGTAVILRDITERKRTERALHDYAGRLQGLSRRLVEIEETERRKINRELHDRIGQNLAALNLNFNIIGTRLSQESRQIVSDLFRKTQALLEETAMHARNVMAELHPPVLDDYGVLAALRSYVDTIGAQAVVQIGVRGTDLAPRLSPAAEMALFRIAQGALANAIQHAQAKHIEVALAATARQVTLRIADDGVGFDPQCRDPVRPSWGLTIMRERAEAVGARLTVASAPGKGTHVSVEIDRQG